MFWTPLLVNFMNTRYQSKYRLFIQHDFYLQIVNPYLLRIQFVSLIQANVLCAIPSPQARNYRTPPLPLLFPHTRSAASRPSSGLFVQMPMRFVNPMHASRGLFPDILPIGCIIMNFSVVLLVYHPKKRLIHFVYYLQCLIMNCYISVHKVLWLSEDFSVHFPSIIPQAAVPLHSDADV